MVVMRDGASLGGRVFGEDPAEVACGLGLGAFLRHSKYGVT